MNIDESRRFEILVNAVVDYAIFLLDPAGTVQTWNPGATLLKGYTADEIVGKSFAIFYTDEDRRAGLPELALQTARAEGRLQAEGWRVRKDGTRFWALVVIDAVRTEDGELVGFAKVTRDITDRHHAQQELLASERRYRRLVDAVIDYAIFQLDANGYVSSWNAGAERIKGYKSAEIIGQHFSAFYTDDDRAKGIPALALEKAATEGRFEAEGRRVRKDGSQFWASVVIDPIVDDDGSISGFAKVTRDITERVQSEARLKESEERLAASQKLEAIGQLSGGIAHDFNNLLMIVIGNLETVQRHARQLTGPAALERAIANAMRGAQRAAALTSRLLAFSRRQALDPKPLNVNKFIGGIGEFLQRTLGERIEVEVAGTAGIWIVEVDSNHLESALVNLAINARDAMPEGGKLTIEAENIVADAGYHRRNPEISPGQYVLICITDTGAGMTQETLEHAFEPFFTTKEVGHGTGLGLSQVYGFVKQSGGHVKIYSEPDQGTTVKIYLPRSTAGVEVEDEATGDQVEEGIEGETILVVEDDEELRAFLADTLRNLSYRVHAAANAQSALTILLQNDRRIDLMMTDVVMPGLNGRELGRRALAMRPGLKILYMTGYSRNAIVHHGRLDEGVEFLQKPFSQAQVALRIRELLDGC